MNLLDDKIISLLKSMNEEIYLVGGTVRDYFINPNFISNDKDIIVTSCSAREFGEKLSSSCEGTLIVLDAENQIYRFIFEDKINYIDITNPIGESLDADLRRRDFTINSIAINLLNGEIIDINNGVDDIKNKKIRGISEQNYIDDALRLLRAFRFQAITGFDIEQSDLEIIRKYVNLINNPAQERINYELIRLFGGEYADKALLNADEAGLLEILFPMINEEKKVPKNSHHHLDLFNHTIETVKQIGILYKFAREEVKSHLDLSDFGGGTRLAHLKLAGFLHDIGKFSTWTIEADGRHRFIMHDEVGAKLVEKFLKNKKYSKKQIDYIRELVRKHIYPSAVAMGAVTDKGINYKSYMKYIRKMGDNSIDAIILSKADRLSARGEEITDAIVNDNLNQLDSLMNYYISVRDSLTPLPKLLAGEEIMAIKHLTPSKELGEIVDKLKEAQISGDVTTKEEAIEFVINL